MSQENKSCKGQSKIMKIFEDDIQNKNTNGYRESKWYEFWSTFCGAAVSRVGDVINGNKTE